MANPILSPLILKVFTWGETNPTGQKIQKCGCRSFTWDVSELCLRHRSDSRPEQHGDKFFLNFLLKGLCSVLV